MKICIFGSEEDKNAIISALSQSTLYTSKEIRVDCYSDYDDFICKVSGNEYDIVFVTADNANGMECVIAAKRFFQTTPIVWLSNDYGFGAQSYRLGTDYFHTKPITVNVIEKALKKCLIKNQI